MDDSSTAGEAGRRADFSSQQWRRLLTDGHAPLVKARARVSLSALGAAVQGVQ
jgi:hypothetical protein